jgi:hypothetical protein
VIKFQKILATASNECGRTDRVYHRIENGDAQPIYQQPHVLLLPIQTHVDNMLKDMKEQEVIEEVKSAWSQPVMLIRKNKDIRFSVNYRQLNEVSNEDVLPLRRTDDTVDTFIRAKQSMSQDLESGY